MATALRLARPPALRLARAAHGHAEPSRIRAILRAALEGKFAGVEYAVDPVFGLEIPRSCEGVPAGVLNPAKAWPDRDTYMRRYRELAARFVDNFTRFEEGCPPVRSPPAGGRTRPTIPAVDT